MNGGRFPPTVFLIEPANEWPASFGYARGLSVKEVGQEPHARLFADRISWKAHPFEQFRERRDGATYWLPLVKVGCRRIW
ncbi:hypothetical protein BB934_44220 (plasmid) [Microvirga ossetica]|uniref:Uncharacterized protein n=1 Tax=Microvirga ossetica TaxID=1882682 RepID=A0A1B2EZ58_9HYPH|nr:hypothetical protein BB934_44220 [Microvirga ossetica]